MLDRLTTTRVAERAGVSVGTLYQYYPNKQSLLFAVLAAHLDHVTAAVEAACEQARNTPLAEMIRTVVEAFVDAKMERSDIPSPCTNCGGRGRTGAGETRRPAISQGAGSDAADGARHRVAARQVRDRDDVSCDGGATRYVLEAGASPAMIRSLRQHLVVLCHSYVRARHAPRR